jgi:HK97 gp10 family phage protein
MADNRIHGLDAALAKLKNLRDPKKVKASCRAAGTKAMRIARDAARTGARRFDDPETPSNIAKNIVTNYSAKQSRGEQVVVRVGVRGGAKPAKGNEDTGHWRFIEFGSSHNDPAKPFMRPALADNVQKITDAFVAALEPAIDKQITKGGP